jgi:excisionase family DNA binding protein
MTTDLTTSQAARKLNITERTVRNWIEDKVIHAYKLNPESKSVYRIPETEVTRILDQRSAARKRKSKAS